MCPLSFLSLVGVSLLLLLMGVKNGKTIPSCTTQLFALVVGTTQVRYRGSFFDILGETLLGYFRGITGSKTTMIWVHHILFLPKNSAHYWVVKHRIKKKKKGKK